MGTHGGCVYKNDQGHMCAVGIHIPEGHPGFLVEGICNKLFNIHPDLAELIIPVDDEHRKLPRYMQLAHDDCLEIEHLRSELRFIADYFSLNPSSIELITEWEGTTL